jgi:anti-sigma regulatory factor (Ser/Thr protein kinase)
MDPASTETVRWSSAPTSTAATRVRRCLAGQLERWGVSAPDAEPVLLVAYELCANAVEHARNPLELVVSFDGQVVVVEVHDESSLEPRLQPFNVEAARGRGLQMVAALAKSWNCVQQPSGKTIRAVLVVGL